MSAEKDEVLATFTIRNEGGEQSGYVTNMFDASGEEVFDPRAAQEFVGYVQEGSQKGFWLRWSAGEDDQWKRVKRH